MAVVAALFELAMARLGWHGLTDLVSADDLRAMRRLARYPRTLAAIAGLVALVVGLLGFLRYPGFAPIGRRLAVAAFAGIFVPSIVVATALPAAALRRKLVIFGLAAANVLVTLLGMSAVRYRSGAGMRLATLNATLACFLSLAVIGLDQLGQTEGGLFAPLRSFFVTRPTSAQAMLLALRHLGELAWMITLFGACWTVATYAGPRGSAAPATSRATQGIAAALAVAFTGAVVALWQLVGHRFRIAIFGTFRFGLVIDDVPGLYAIPIGVGLAGGLVGLGRRAPALRQLGAAILAWLAAGYAPHTPIQLLYMVLGAMLLTRSAQALDPDGPWRTRQPWARLTRSVRG